MGDMSAEPSMEEILSSIKRIIAEEGDGPARARRAQRPAPTLPADEPENESSELSEPVPASPPEPAALTSALATPSMLEADTQAERASIEPSPRPDFARSASILSPQTEEASRSALDTLSRILVKPEPGSDGTLEGLVRELLRPILREWLDAHLPAIVESMVQTEILRITGRPR